MLVQQFGIQELREHVRKVVVGACLAYGQAPINNRLLNPSVLHSDMAGLAAKASPISND